jgi:hypothetical protein
MKNKAVTSKYISENLKIIISIHPNIYEHLQSTAAFLKSDNDNNQT